MYRAMSTISSSSTSPRSNRASILVPEPSIDGTYCTEREVLVCCPLQNSGNYKIPDYGFLSPDCRLADQYGVEFGKYACRCCGAFFEAVEGKPLAGNCVDVAYDADSAGTMDEVGGSMKGRGISGGFKTWGER